MAPKAITTYYFKKTPYTRESLYDMKAADLVALFNTLAPKAGKPETRRFASIGSGVDRTWALLEQFGESHVDLTTGKPPKGEKADEPKSADKKPRQAQTKSENGGPRGTNLKPSGHAPLPCRAGTKQATLVDQLKKDGGVTMPQLIAALSGGNKPWTEVSVRSGFGWDMKQKGYGVLSTFNSVGTERFSLVVPEGYEVPAHIPLKSAQTPDPRQTKLKL